ncbi:MAG: tetratricopeptide repeat protein, partial [Planctomycetota bacterium]
MPRETRPGARWVLLFAVVLLAATMLIYRPAWRGEQVWDDDAHITKLQLRSAEGLRRIWFDLGATQQYYPLVHSAFWAQHKLWGDSTLGYHLVNIALHGLAAVLVALILRRLGAPGALLAAAIFALHPVHAESVAWISELKNTLSAVFYLGAALSYLRFDQSRSKAAYAAAAALFVMALLSKTVTATLPAALLLIFWWKRGRISWKRDVLPLVPLFVLGIAAGLLTSWVERKFIGAEGAAFDFTLIERFFIAGRAVCFYLGKLFWPANLTFTYPRWRVSETVWWQYLFPLAVAGLFFALWRLRGRTRGPLAAMLFFVGTLLPVLGFFNVFPFRFSFVADHFQYLASLGVIALSASGLIWLVKRFGRHGRALAWVAAAAILTASGSLTWQQSRLYKDAKTLYQATLELNPESWMAHNNLGGVLMRQNEPAQATYHFRQAVRLMPKLSGPRYNLGCALLERRLYKEAAESLRKAVTIDPKYLAAWYNLGRAYAGQKDFKAAIAAYHKALSLHPKHINARYNLALAFLGAKDFGAATREFRGVLSLEKNP